MELLMDELAGARHRKEDLRECYEVYGASSMGFSLARPAAP